MWCRQLILSRTRLLWHSSLYTLGGLLPQALNVLLLPLYTRYLSREDFGILSYTSALCVFSSILGSLTISSYLLKRFFQRDRSEQTAIFGAVFGFLGVYNALLLALQLSALPTVFDLLDVRVPFVPYMQLALVRTAFEVMVIVPMMSFRVREQVGRFVAFSASTFVLSAGGSLYLILAHRLGVLGWLYGQLFGYGVMLVVGGLIVARMSRISLDPAELRPALAFCLPLVPAQFVASFQTLSDRLVLERYVPMGDLGVYAVALAIASAVQVVSTGVFRAIEPSVYGLAGAGTLDAGIARIKNYFLLLILTAGCLLIALSQEVVSLLSEPKFHDARHVLPLLVATIAVSGLTNLRSLYLIASGTTQYETPLRLAGAGVSIVGLVLFVPTLGILGAALASLVAALALFSLFSWAVARRGGVGWSMVGDLLILAGGFTGSVVVVDVHAIGVVAGLIYKLSLIALPLAVAGWWLTRTAPALGKV